MSGIKSSIYQWQWYKVLPVSFHVLDGIRQFSYFSVTCFNGGIVRYSHNNLCKLLVCGSCRNDVLDFQSEFSRKRFCKDEFDGDLGIAFHHLFA